MAILGSAIVIVSCQGINGWRLAGQNCRRDLASILVTNFGILGQRGLLRSIGLEESQVRDADDALGLDGMAEV